MSKAQVAVAVVLATILGIGVGWLARSVVSPLDEQLFGIGIGLADQWADQRFRDAQERYERLRLESDAALAEAATSAAEAEREVERQRRNMARMRRLHKSEQVIRDARRVAARQAADRAEQELRDVVAGNREALLTLDNLREAFAADTDELEDEVESLTEQLAEQRRLTQTQALLIADLVLERSALLDRVELSDNRVDTLANRRRSVRWGPAVLAGVTTPYSVGRSWRPTVAVGVALSWW